MARQGRAGQGRAGQGRAGQGRAGQGRAEQGRAEQDTLPAQQHSQGAKPTCFFIKIGHGGVYVLLCVRVLLPVFVQQPLS